MIALSGNMAMDGESFSVLCFRIARVLLLLLAIILPWEAITAVREMTLVGCLVFLGLHYYLSGDFQVRATAVFLPLLFYVICAIFSLVSAVDLAYSLKEMRSEVLKSLIIFYCAVYFIKGQDELKQSWIALLSGLAVMNLFGVVLFFMEGGSLLGHAHRAGSLHEGYGGLATYLCLLWPFLLLAPRTFGSRFRSLFWALVPLTVFVAYITYSRIAWITLVVETGLIWLIMSRHRRKVAAIALVLILLAGAALFSLPGSRHGETWSRIIDRPRDVGGTAGDLIALWSHSYREIKKHPFMGIGLGRRSFDKAYPEFRATHQPLLFHAHNMFVDITLQLGIQGLVAILCIMGVLGAALWPAKPPPAERPFENFTTAAVVSMLGFCLRNLTDDFFVKDSALLFWLLMGLALGARHVWLRQNPRPNGGALADR